MTVTSMPQPTLPTQRFPGTAEEVILGVDTHKDVHVAAVIAALGASFAHQEFPATTVASAPKSADGPAADTRGSRDWPRNQRSRPAPRR